MKYIYDTDTDIFLGPIQDLEKPCPSYEFPSDSILQKMSPEINTGIMPCTESGLVSYRAKNGYEQLVIQIAPGIYTVRWGYRERDPNAKLYEFAMPYRIVIADFENGTFLGLRHFFSMTPAYALETPLYATAFANTNNTGYRNTSVGWTCLYHTRNTPFVDLAEKIDYCITRESGFNEPYNDVNMSSTDGPGFHKKFMPKKTHFHSKDNWQAWTKKNGMAEVFDPSNYIQYNVKVTDAAFAATHTTDAGAVPYTLGDAMYKNYAPYYGKTEVKPINGGKSETAGFGTLLRTVANPKAKRWTAGGKVEKKVPSKLSAAKSKVENLLDGTKCPCCMKLIPYGHTFLTVIDSWDAENNNKPVTENICQDCYKKFTVEVEYTSPAKVKRSARAMKKALLHSQAYGLWLAPHDATQCNWCGDAAPKDQAHNFLVYGSSIMEDDDECCVSCFNGCFIGDEEGYGDEWMSEEDALRRDIRHNKLVYIDFVKEVEALTPGQDGTLVLAKQYAHISYADNVCKCGMFVGNPEVDCLKEKNENGTYTCNTCVDQPIIKIDKTPVAIQTKGQQ